VGNHAIDVPAFNLAMDVQLLASKNAGIINPIGWSRGGLYVRELGKRLPDRVRQLITLGTSIAGGAARPIGR